MNAEYHITATAVMTSATSMLARMKLVFVHSLGVSRIVTSVNPLPQTLDTFRVMRMVVLRIIAIAGCPAVPAALPVVAIVTLMMLLTLTSGDSDVIISDNVIVPFLYH